MALYTNMFTELVRLQIELWNGLEAHLAETADLTLAQFQALAAIRMKGDTARVQDISDEMSITVGATSKLVDRLEHAGLAVRSAHPFDRRSSLVATSKRGGKALIRADAATEEYLRGLLAPTLPDARAASFLSDLLSLRNQSRARVVK